MNQHQPQEQLQNATLILVLGILSIVGCFCYGILGVILGVIAIVLAQKATRIHMQDPDLYLGYQNVKIGKILAIIGIVLSILYLLFIVWLIVTFGMEALQDPDLLQSRVQEWVEQKQ